MDDRDQNGRQYVTVQAIHYADGETVPVKIFYPGERIYPIRSSKVIEKIKNGDRTESSTYEVVINGRKTKLYFERGKWAVLVKAGRK
ncbi:MAG: hypothetical protein IKF39_10380 [Oscillospiraceae bacterium]|nr:hypothetical protein [Oscillospiraceae bacterium]